MALEGFQTLISTLPSDSILWKSVNSSILYKIAVICFEIKDYKKFINVYLQIASFITSSTAAIHEDNLSSFYLKSLSEYLSQLKNNELHADDKNDAIAEDHSFLVHPMDIFFSVKILTEHLPVLLADDTFEIDVAITNNLPSVL